MTKETLENLSCLMDGELSRDASRFLARRMGSDDQLCDTWQRYHLIRDCMRSPGDTIALAGITLDFDALDAELEPDQVKGNTAAATRWLKPLSGLAVAASVAMVAVLVTLNLNPAANNEPETAAQPFNSPNALNGFPISQPASLNPAPANSQRQLNRYLLRHNQVAGAVGPKGFVSFVPIVNSAPVQIVDAESADVQAEELNDPSTVVESTER